MSPRTSLDFRNLDNTWEMNSLTRKMFRPGVLEGSGIPSMSGGNIEVSPYTIISMDGVTVWDESSTQITAPAVDGVYYVTVRLVRSESTPISSLTITATVTPPVLASGDINFGTLTVSGVGTVFTFSYANRPSIGMVGNGGANSGGNGGRFRGLIDIGSVPAVSDPDLQDGDLFIVWDLNGVYTPGMHIYIWNATDSVWHIVTNRSITTKDRIVLQAAPGIHSITIESGATTGQLKAGNGYIESFMDPGPVSRAVVNRVQASEYLDSPIAKLDSIVPKTAAEVGIGSVDAHAIVPYADNKNAIGSTSKYIRQMYANNVKALSIRPKVSGTSDVGISTDYFLNGGFANMYTALLKGIPAVAAGSIAIGNHLYSSPSGTINMGTASNRFLKGWFTSLDSSTVNVTDLIAQSTAIENTGHFLPKTTALYDLGNTARRWKEIWGLDMTLTQVASVLGGIKSGDTTTAVKWKVVEGDMKVGASDELFLDTDATIINATSILGFNILIEAEGGLNIWVPPQYSRVGYLTEFRYSAYFGLYIGGADAGRPYISILDRGTGIDAVALGYKITVYYK